MKRLMTVQFRAGRYDGVVEADITTYPTTVTCSLWTRPASRVDRPQLVWAVAQEAHDRETAWRTAAALQSEAHAAVAMGVVGREPLQQRPLPRRRAS